MKRFLVLIVGQGSQESMLYTAWRIHAGATLTNKLMRYNVKVRPWTPTCTTRPRLRCFFKCHVVLLFPSPSETNRLAQCFVWIYSRTLSHPLSVVVVRKIQMRCTLTSRLFNYPSKLGNPVHRQRKAATHKS